MAEAHTSDGEERPNQRAPIVVVVPTSIGANQRVGVLNDLATALGIPALDRNASYSQTAITQRLNDITGRVNVLASAQVLPTYGSVDYNSFVSICRNIAAAMAALP